VNLTSRGRGLLSPEHRLLLVLSGDRNTDDQLIALIRGGVNWDTVLLLAERERASAELYRRVRHLLGVEVPPATLSALQRMAMVSDFEMLHLEQCLRETLDLLAAANARVMLLKGAALAYSVYGGAFAKRPMSDIDLLVDEARAADIQRQLLAGRWKRTSAPVGDEVYDEHHHLPPLRDARGSGVHLELHTALFAPGHPFGLTPDVLWRDARPLASAVSAGAATSATAFLPSLGHQLLHTCLHFAWSHAMKFGAWRTFRDVRATLATEQVDWDAFVRMARDSRATTACYWTFRLAQVAADIRVPPEVERALRPPRPTAYLRGIERHYLLNLFPASQVCPSVQLDRALWDLGMLPGWSGHGDIRPWDQDADFLPPGNASHPRAKQRRLQQLWQSTRYLRALVGLGRLERAKS
jgi:hypothetical protein